MDQVIDISSDGLHLSCDRGFLKVSKDGAEAGRVALDQITALIIHAHGTTYSNNLLVALAGQGSPAVICAANHQPCAVLMPLDGSHAQGARMRAQWDAGVPLMKQLWKTIVISKIKMQAAALQAYGLSPGPLLFLARQVKSNDEGNLEAQAARRYWPEMMGKEFRRDAGLPGANALLNYGYTVMRATAARAIVASGLNPTMGLFHANRGNAFALADDIMEPFRPLVDCAVRGMMSVGESDVTTEAKRCLARLTALDLNMGEVQSPVSVALTRLAQSLAQSFLTGKNCLELPIAPTPMEMAALGKDLL